MNPKLIRKALKDPLGQNVLLALLEHEYLSMNELEELLKVSNWGKLYYIMRKLEGLIQFDLKHNKNCLTEDGRLISEALAIKNL